MAWVFESKRYPILVYVEEHAGVSRGEIAEALKITYDSARYHLEKLVSEGLLERYKQYIYGAWEWRYRIYVPPVPPVLPRAPEPYVGLSVTYNAKTGGKEKKKPLMDITVTVQTVIKREEETRVIYGMPGIEAIVERWFTAKFGSRQGLAMKPEPSIDYFEPTVGQMEKFYGKLYSYFWRWSRGAVETAFGRIEGRSQQGSGEENQWEDLPTEYEIGTGESEWEKSRRGKKKGGKKGGE